MQCPKCGGDTKVIDSRQTQWDIIRRRRQCLSCEHRFNTAEREEKETEEIPNYGITKTENRYIQSYRFPDGLKITIGKSNGEIMIENMKKRSESSKC